MIKILILKKIEGKAHWKLKTYLNNVVFKYLKVGSKGDCLTTWEREILNPGTNTEKALPPHLCLGWHSEKVPTGGSQRLGDFLWEQESFWYVGPRPLGALKDDNQHIPQWSQLQGLNVEGEELNFALQEICNELETNPFKIEQHLSVQLLRFWTDSLNLTITSCSSWGIQIPSSSHLHRRTGPAGSKRVSWLLPRSLSSVVVVVVGALKMENQILIISLYKGTVCY